MGELPHPQLPLTQSDLHSYRSGVIVSVTSPQRWQCRGPGRLRIARQRAESAISPKRFVLSFPEPRFADKINIVISWLQLI